MISDFMLFPLQKVRNSYGNSLRSRKLFLFQGAEILDVIDGGDSGRSLFYPPAKPTGGSGGN